LIAQKAGATSQLTDTFARIAFEQGEVL